MKVGPPIDGQAVITGFKVDSTGLDWESATLSKDQIDFGDILNITAPKITIGNKSKNYGVEASGKLSLSVGGGVEASGTVEANYDGATKDWAVKLQNGQASATLAGQKLLVDGLSYENKVLKATKASLKLPAFDVEGNIQGVTISKEGVEFTGGTVKVNKDIDLLPGNVSLTGILITLEKAGKDFTMSAGGALVVKSGSPRAEGRAQGSFKLAEGSISEGTVESISLDTDPLKLTVTNFKYTRGVGFKADEAGVTIKEGAGENIKNLIPSFDPGLLDGLGAGNPGVTAKDISLGGGGLKIASFKPQVPPLSYNFFGAAKATLDIANKSGKIEGGFQFPGDKVPGWPFELRVGYPLVPGVLEVSGFIKAYGDLEVGLGGSASMGSGTPAPWTLAGNGKFNGKLGLELGLGADLGSPFLVSIGADLFARAETNFAATGNIKGEIAYDKEKKTIKKTKDIELDYDLKSVFKAAVGARIRAKVLLFFEKKLYEIKFKEWTLGEFHLGGRIYTDEAGERKVEKTKEWGFAGGKPGEPTVEQRTPAGAEAQELLKSASLKIEGSGPARQKIVNQVKTGFEKSLKSAETKIKYEEQRLGVKRKKLQEVEASLKKHEERLVKLDKNEKVQSTGFFKSFKGDRTKKHEEERLAHYQALKAKVDTSITKHDSRLVNMQDQKREATNVLSDVEKAIADLKSLEEGMGDNLNNIEKEQQEINDSVRLAEELDAETQEINNMKV